MIEILPRLVILVFSVIFHEVSHGYAALWRGDHTAKNAGRLTLNPIPHIDPFGTILLPLILVLAHSSILIGSAKPVPINPWNFKNPQRDTALVALSGPASNLFLALLCGIAARVLLPILGIDSMFVRLAVYGVLVNLVLAYFNLVPIPPLDGSRILALFLPRNLAEVYAKIEPFGFFIVLGLLYLGLFNWIVLPVISLTLSIFLGSDTGLLMRAL
jgi:Zn-dependent protease